MNGGVLQRGVDRARAASRQRRVLGAIALVAASGASASANVAAQDGSVFLFGLVLVLALASAVEPDSHVGSWVIAIVVGQWALVVDDITTPLVVATAICLLVFHTVTALMASMPSSATVDALTLRRWSSRGTTVVPGAVAMWALVATFDRWRLPGGAALIVLGFVLLAAAATALVVRSHP